MKGCILETNLEGQEVVNNTAYRFVGSNLQVEIFLQTEGTLEKGCAEKIEVSLHTLYWVFKKIPFTHYTCFLANILQNGAKFIKKTESWFQKSHEEFVQLQTSSGKSKKLKFNGLLLSKKFLQLKQ